MKPLLLTFLAAMTFAARATADNAPKPLYGVGYVVVNPQKDPAAGRGEIEAALDIADRCRESGLNHISLAGPLLFRDMDSDSQIEALIPKLHEKGLTVSYCINTFLDRGKQHRESAWRDPKGTTVGDEYFCMVASRAERVPEIKRCIEKGVQVGFDGVFLDFLDWGTDQDNICFCDTCVREFNAFAGKSLSRDKLVEKLLSDDRLIPAWWDWRMKVRTDIAAELIKYARDAAAKHKRPFWVGQLAGRRGSEPEYCGGLFDVHAPVVSGAKVGGSIESYDQVKRAVQSWKRRVPKTTTVVAFLPADVPPEELKALAEAAISGGADGWVFLPAAKLTEDAWKALADAVRASQGPM